MKILITTDWDVGAVNGVATSVASLRRALTEAGHDVRVLTLSPDRYTRFDGTTWRLGSHSAGRLYPGARVRCASAAPAVRELVDWRPDIVHSQCEFSTFGPAVQIARGAGAPLVHTWHTVYSDYTHYFCPNRRAGRALVGALARSVGRQCDLIAAPSAKVRDRLLAEGVPCPVALLPTGLDMARFAAPGREISRAALGIPSSNRVLVALGRLAQEKNVAELIDLCAMLGPGVTLLLVGDGPDRPRLESHAARRGLGPDRVVFAGMAPPADTPAWYAVGDAFVCASTSETQGLTYLEALGAGLPCVCRADPCLDGVIVNGVNGWQYTDPAEAAARLKGLFADEAARAAMARRAAQSAQAHGLAAFGQNALRLYRHCLNRPQHQPVWPEGGLRLWQAV